MNALSCLVVDDEPVAQRIIASYLADIPGFKVVGYCGNALEAMDWLNRESVDLLFLDIEMPKIKGLAFLKSIHQPPPVILTTAHREFALDGFELGVVDYLLKPIAFERFLKAIQRFQALYQDTKGTPAEGTAEETRILLKSERKMYRIHPRQIHYIEGLSNYVQVFLEDGKKLIVHYSLQSILQDLPNNFLRIHKSFLVNRQHIVAFSPEEVQLPTGQVLPVGGTFRKKVLEILRQQ